MLRHENKSLGFSGAYDVLRPSSIYMERASTWPASLSITIFFPYVNISIAQEILAENLTASSPSRQCQ